SFMWEHRGNDRAQDRAALLSAVGWCSAGRAWRASPHWLYGDWQREFMSTRPSCKKEALIASPANFCAGGADVRRYHPMPTNGVGVRIHDVWLVNAAVNAEAELVIADAAAPIRLRRRAHGAHGDGTESLFHLVLLDVIGKRELCATDRCLLVESVSRAR